MLSCTKNATEPLLRGPVNITRFKLIKRQACGPLAWPISASASWLPKLMIDCWQFQDMQWVRW